MALADDIVKAAAKAIARAEYTSAYITPCEWHEISVSGREQYMAMGRAAVAAALYTLAQAQDDIHDHGGIRPMDLEALAVLMREGTR